VSVAGRYTRADEVLIAGQGTVDHSLAERSPVQGKTVCILPDFPVLATCRARPIESKGIVSVTIFEGCSVLLATSLIEEAKSAG
jgi:hypothetical protein